MIRGGDLYLHGNEPFVTAGRHPDQPSRILLQGAGSGLSKYDYWYWEHPHLLQEEYLHINMPPEKPHD